MTNSYSEDILVEQPTIALFETLEWETVNCYNEQFGSTLNSEVMEKVEALLDESVATEAYVIVSADKPIWERQHDLSKIDFEALRKRFVSGSKRTEIERLRVALERKLRELVAGNWTRMDYLERFQEKISEYNSGAHNVEAILPSCFVLPSP